MFEFGKFMYCAFHWAQIVVVLRGAYNHIYIYIIMSNLDMLEFWKCNKRGKKIYFNFKFLPLYPNT